MVVLQANQGSLAMINSGLTAAIISGIVAFIGYVINAVMQSKNNSKLLTKQEEIAKMQNDEKLFYEKQIEWANETRKQVAKYVTDCIELNRYIKLVHDLDKGTLKGKEIQEYAKKINKASDRVRELTLNLQEETTMIRLYLFHDKDNYEGMVREKMLGLEQYLSKGEEIPNSELDVFVDVARQMFNHQMEELKMKTA